MTNWVDNLLLYCDTKKIGVCPYCGSASVEVEELHIGRWSISFRCKHCGKGAHFDGAATKEE